jgi:hypothetical protein
MTPVYFLEKLCCKYCKKINKEFNSKNNAHRCEHKQLHVTLPRMPDILVEPVEKAELGPGQGVYSCPVFWTLEREGPENLALIIQLSGAYRIERHGYSSCSKSFKRKQNYSASARNSKLYDVACMESFT